ncbi:antimicrobial peptide THP1-like [Aquila chrysaetos chrysaetos]|uniref:antimicrobial peptide THP1-like n=1 Tax=Aquila chrysaetos chrysaetos TaxID=223781 RepID=UPI00117650C3|nr:antimicrobial peptide THP1-like [Aquila chrysaetos chrysaetos]
MKILYLLFPFFLLLVQGAAGVSLTPRNESQCKQEGGFCSFLTCYHPHHIFGRCSAFMVCCKSVGHRTISLRFLKTLGFKAASTKERHAPRFWLLEPSPVVLSPPCLCRPQVV